MKIRQGEITLRDWNWSYFLLPQHGPPWEEERGEPVVNKGLSRSSWIPEELTGMYNLECASLPHLWRNTPAKPGLSHPTGWYPRDWQLEELFGSGPQEPGGRYGEFGIWTNGRRRFSYQARRGCSQIKLINGVCLKSLSAVKQRRATAAGARFDRQIGSLLREEDPSGFSAGGDERSSTPLSGHEDWTERTDLSRSHLHIATFQSWEKEKGIAGCSWSISGDVLNLSWQKPLRPTAM